MTALALHPAFAVAFTVARVALAFFAAIELEAAMAAPRGRVRQRHAVLGIIVLIGVLIRL